MQQTWRDQPLKNSHGADKALSAQLKFHFRFFSVKKLTDRSDFPKPRPPGTGFSSRSSETSLRRFGRPQSLELHAQNPRGLFVMLLGVTTVLAKDVEYCIYIGRKFKMFRWPIYQLQSVIKVSKLSLVLVRVGSWISNPRLNSYLKFYQSYRE